VGRTDAEHRAAQLTRPSTGRQESHLHITKENENRNSEIGGSRKINT
jgi:hypothetical protein